MQTCKEWFTEGLKRFGYSAVGAEVKAWKSKRLENADRPARIKVSLNARRHMYVKQSGKCGICGEPMDGNIQRLDVDHIDANAAEFNARTNLHLTHPSCNRSKGAKSLAEVAKGNGRTVTQMLGGVDDSDL